MSVINSFGGQRTVRCEGQGRAEYPKMVEGVEGYVFCPNPECGRAVKARKPVWRHDGRGGRYIGDCQIPTHRRILKSDS